jgi:hypothetical protein
MRDAPSAAAAGAVCALHASLRAHIRRVPRIRALLRLRLLCLAGRAAPTADAHPAVRWLCTAAPLWVFVAVCARLRNEWTGVY